MQIVERNNKNLTINGITDREIRSRNFKGEEKKHPITGKTVNSAGYRNFLLYIPEDIAEELKNVGCDVKYTKLRDPNDIAVPYVSVNVSYYLRAPEAWSCCKGVNTPLDEAHIHLIDDYDIQNACVTLEFGKEKTKINGDKYIPLYLSFIKVDIVPNYVREQFAYLYDHPAAEQNGDMPF